MTSADYLYSTSETRLKNSIRPQATQTHACIWHNIYAPLCNFCQNYFEYKLKKFQRCVHTYLMLVRNMKPEGGRQFPCLVDANECRNWKLTKYCIYVAFLPKDVGFSCRLQTLQGAMFTTSTFFFFLYEILHITEFGLLGRDCHNFMLYF